MHSTRREIAQVHSVADSIPLPGTIASNETDSNADTCCLGANFTIMNYTSRTADVYPYDSTYAPMKNVPIVRGGTAWDDPITHRTYILVIDEGLYYGTKLDHSLLNPNQIRNFGNGYWDNPFDPAHSLCIETDTLQIPLYQHSTKIEFQSRVPTDEELDSCEKIYLTDSFPWDPNTVRFNISAMQVMHSEPVKKVCELGSTDYPVG